MIDSTTIILTRDEERNLETCIRRLKGFAARIVVVDSGSTDRTLDIARELGADIFVHEPYVDYGAQFNWAIEHTGIDTEWIMRVDADEYWTPELCAEVEALVQQHAQIALTVADRAYVLGTGRITISGDAADVLADDRVRAAYLGG